LVEIGPCTRKHYRNLAKNMGKVYLCFASDPDYVDPQLLTTRVRVLVEVAQAFNTRGQPFTPNYFSYYNNDYSSPNDREADNRLSQLYRRTENRLINPNNNNNNAFQRPVDTLLQYRDTYNTLNINNNANNNNNNNFGDFKWQNNNAWPAPGNNINFNDVNNEQNRQIDLKYRNPEAKPRMFFG